MPRNEQHERPEVFRWRWLLACWMLTFDEHFLARRAQDKVQQSGARGSTAGVRQPEDKQTSKLQNHLNWMTRKAAKAEEHFGLHLHLGQRSPGDRHFRTRPPNDAMMLRLLRSEGRMLRSLVYQPEQTPARTFGTNEHL